ncbi:MAG: hypothetical protein M3N82_14020 [Pseudomonadota bacterium]|nr:hypothetical protein [Pseudomonadota bacterium]
MPGFLKRTLAVLVGVVLGMAIVSGAGPWRELFKKPDTTPPAPIQRERAPDQRV